MTNTTPRHTHSQQHEGGHTDRDTQTHRAEGGEIRSSWSCWGRGGSRCQCSPLPLTAPGWGGGEAGNPQPLGGAAPGGADPDGSGGAPGSSFHPAALRSPPAHTRGC